MVLARVFFKPVCIEMKSQDSTVGRASGYRLDEKGVGV
jgi:hypothetical protein